MNRGKKDAFGRPGKTPYWAPADKDGVGAACNPANRVWFTLWRGILTETYYPTVDCAQMRDLQVAFTHGEGRVSVESRDFDCRVEREGCTQAYHIRARAKAANYGFEKDVICGPHSPCVLERFKLWGDENVLKRLRVYVLCNPHLDTEGWTRRARVASYCGRKQLIATSRRGRRLALGADCGFSRASCGFAGASDGLTDLLDNGKMDWEFDAADSGNVVLTGELPPDVREFVICVSFGESTHGAMTAMLQSLSADFDELRCRYISEWESAMSGRLDLSSVTGDGGREYRVSCNVLLTHEDRTYEGALVASLAVPWGEARETEGDRGGYHLVWPRDMVQGSTALLACGDRATSLRALTYLAIAQRDDGSFAQNFWVDGRPNWTGLQLDEVTYPVLLARRLHRENALGKFDPRPMVFKAIEYIVCQGPVTPQDRWEQLGGYSPSTLAILIASLISAAAFARESGLSEGAQFLEEYADWLRDHIERWTVTHHGELVAGISRHFVRLTPATPGDASPVSPDQAILILNHQPPGRPVEFPARNVVDAGFLSLVRYGIMDAHDPLIVDSLHVVDAVLKVETPFGPCWRRYNHDGYGQRDDGSAFDDWGRGRAWPLLTGERGHYELMAGRDPQPYIQTMERLANATGLLAEQVWDQHFIRDGVDYFGRPTDSAMPLAWAHAEYIKLVRSAKDGRVFDLIPEVEQRYHGAARVPTVRRSMWTKRYPTPVMRPGETLRIYAEEPFRLRYSLDNWAAYRDDDSIDTGLGIYFVDVKTAGDQRMPARFTFYWNNQSRWHGCDFAVAMEQD